MTHCILIGAPIDCGQQRPGCLMGPSAYRVAGLAGAIADLGHQVTDRGDLALPAVVAQAGRQLHQQIHPVFLSHRTTLECFELVLPAHHF